MRRLVGNPLVILLVVAGTAALIVLPFTVGAGDADLAQPAPRAPVATSASPTETDGLVVTDRQQADVDGDGHPDEVRLLDDPSEEIGDGAVEVTLADGSTGSAVVPF